MVIYFNVFGDNIAICIVATRQLFILTSRDESFLFFHIPLSIYCHLFHSGGRSNRCEMESQSSITLHFPVDLECLTVVQWIGHFFFSLLRTIYLIQLLITDFLFARLVFNFCISLCR